MKRPSVVRAMIYALVGLALVVLSGLTWRSCGQLTDARREVRELREQIFRVCNRLKLTDQATDDRLFKPGEDPAAALLEEAVARARRKAIEPALGECNVNGPVLPPPM